MDIASFDPIIKLLPGIKKPDKPLTLKEKLKWTGIIMSIYFVLFSVPAFGVNASSLSQTGALQLISIVFAARLGTLITVGISPIVVAGIIFSFLSGAGIIKVDQTDMAQRSRMQGMQKFVAIVIAFLEAFIFVATGQVTLLSASFFGIVAFQLFLGALCIIYLDEAMSKFGITSGINMFISANVSYSIIAGTITILLGEAIAAIAAGSAAAIPNAILSFAPLFFAAIVLLVSIYVYETSLEIPLVFSQFRGVGGRLPIPLLYVSVLPVVLATAFILNLVILSGFLAHYSGPFPNVIHFIAYYNGTTGGRANLVGGLVYLLSPSSFPLPYAAQYGGIGGYANYFSYFFTQSSPLYVPLLAAPLLIPEWLHAIFYMIVLVLFCIIFGKFWTEMAGQNPKALAEQLQDTGWQIPGFRRDPRTIESVLNRYIPHIIVLGSVVVGILAAFATLTAAIGSGTGILLTVGILYMVFKQLDQERMIEGYPGLDKLLN